MKIKKYFFSGRNRLPYIRKKCVEKYLLVRKLAKTPTCYFNANEDANMQTSVIGHIFANFTDNRTIIVSRPILLGQTLL